MKFYLGGSMKSTSQKINVIILVAVSWNDWFTYETLYNVFYYDAKGTIKGLGTIKIGQKSMEPEQRSPNLPDCFEQLSHNFFSVGQDVSYYETLNEDDMFRDELLTGLNDISYSPNIYECAIKEKVTKISLLRSVSPTSVEGQFRRLALGNSELTSYSFKYHVPKHPGNTRDGLVLDFNVVPNSNPPSNIHVIIGRNGVGKTHLFNNMINALLTGNSTKEKHGFFENVSNSRSENLFSNLVSVAFSAFDEDANPRKEEEDKTKHLNYSYIGLKQIGEINDDLLPKSPAILKDEFVLSVTMCRLGAKNRRWLNALEILEADPIFKEAEVSKIAKLAFDDDFVELASKMFESLSSGHKIVLLSITRLVETIEEKSLVLLDEPEGYLHPPLLSAFIRALSDLLISRNAVAIIGTHSPVVLQEVPKSCIWKLRRTNITTIAERLEIESFGENIGSLTQEVFGLEVTDSGFHKILQKIAQEVSSYEEAISLLNNQLGLEGKAILRNLLRK